MRIRSFLHPAVLLAHADGASFVHVDRIRASCGSSVADPSSSASKSLLRGTNTLPRQFVPAANTKQGFPKCPGRRLFHAFRRYRLAYSGRLQNAQAA
jgi:hypothetical protein